MKIGVPAVQFSVVLGRFFGVFWRTGEIDTPAGVHDIYTGLGIGISRSVLLHSIHPLQVWLSVFVTVQSRVLSAAVNSHISYGRIFFSTV